MDRHHRVAQQRVQPGPLGRHRRARLEGVGEAQQQHREEGGEPEQDGLRVGRHLAQPVVRQPQRQAGEAREQQDPEQQGALLRGPDRGRLVEVRRGRARVRGDDVEGEVRAQERRLEQREGHGDDPEHGVHRAAARLDPGLAVGASPVQRGPDPVQRRRQGEDQAGTADDDHAALRPSRWACP